jgi:tetratricopeptide (TPR) repeat protein
MPILRGFLLGAMSCSILMAIPVPASAQTHGVEPQPGAASSQHDHSGGAGKTGTEAPTPHDGMQHAGESQAEMMWSMYTDLGNRAYQHGLYGEAEKTFKSALKEARTFGPTDRRLPLSLNNLAEVYRMEGRLAESEQLAREGLVIREGAFGPNDSSVADSLNTLALARHAQGQPAEAQALYQRALGIWEQTLGPNHARVAVLLNNLAIAHRDLGQLDAAEPLLRRALAIREGINGLEHLEVALALRAIADVERAKGRYGEAEATGLRAVKIIET